MVPRVEIWLLDLAAATASLLEIEAREGLLARTDRQRVASLADSSAVNERLAGLVALRLLIEGVAGTHVRAVDFEREAGGKPRLPGRPVHFSLSHVAGQVLLAIADGPVGIDLELPRAVRIDGPRRAKIEAAASALAPEQPLPPVGEVGDEARFLQAWTRLEALAKADGRGIGWLLGAIGAFGPSRGPGDGEPGVELALAELRSRHALRDLALDWASFGAIAGPVGLAPSPIRRVPNALADLRALLASRRALACHG